MKRTSLIIAATIFSFAISISVQGQNQYRSVATGNWSAIGTWEVSTDGVTFVPAVTTPGTLSTDTVLVRNSHTVTENTNATIAQLTVGEGASGILRFDNSGTGKTLTVSGAVTIAAAGTIDVATGGSATTHTLAIAGNFSVGNSARFDGKPATSRLLNVIFNSQSASDQTISSPGTPTDVNFNRITLDRGAASRKVVCSTSATVSGGANSFTWTNGTWEQTAFNLTIASGNQDITVNGTLRITGSASFTHLSASMPSGSGGFAGNFFINTSGNISIGSGSDSLDVGTGSLEIQAGNVSIGGQLRASGAGTFTMLGGQVTIDPQKAGPTNLSSSKHTFELVGASNVSFTGGTVTIIDPNASTGTGNSLQVVAGAGTKNFAGSTIAFGDGTSSTSGSADQFELNAGSGVNLGNIVINNPSGTNRNVVLTSNTANIGGNLTITAGTLDAAALNINLKGNWTNNGAFTAGSGTVTFNGSAVQTITGATTFNNLILANTSGGLDATTAGANITVNHVLTINQDTDLNMGSNSLLTVSNTAGESVTAGTGQGEVVGLVRRTAFTSGQSYGFGSPFVQLGTFTFTGAPTQIDVTMIQERPTTFSQAVKRTYQIDVSGGSGLSTTLRLHYRDDTDTLNGNSEVSLGLWRGPSWTDIGATTRDGGNNWVEKTAISTFSPWTLANTGIVPTVVRLTKFNAASFSDGVQLSWESGFEVNNLGYHLYREQNGKRTRVTPSVVAGSALSVGQGNRLTAGYSYAWFDPKGTADTAYYLEAIDLNGTRQWSGPIYPYGGASSKAPRRERALLLGELATASNGTGSATNSGLSNVGWPAAMKDSARAETLKLRPASIVTQQAIAAGKAVKISVRQSGWYRLTQPELVAAGFDPASDARMLQLYVDGQEVPIGLSSEGGRLNANDTLEFYGLGLDTPTTDTRVYWLINGTSPGKRISAKRVKMKPGDQNWTENTALRSFDFTTERREKLIYSSHLLNGDADNIFGALIFSDPLDQTLKVSNLDRDSGTQPQLEVALQGLTAQSHEVRVQFNGADVGTMSFTGSEHPTAKFNINRSLVREGDNAVSLTSMIGEADISFVDSIRVTYAHRYTVDNNALRFTVPGGQTVRVDGFTSQNIRVIDVTNPTSPLELATLAAPSGSGYSVKMQTLGTDVRTLLAFADDLAGHHPASIAANKPSSWNAGTNGADMVIITHKDFHQATEPLASLRRNQGMSVAVVDVEDVYDEFSYGAHTPVALKSFLSWAAGNWSRKPQYLLLVGDSSWDPRNYMGQGENDFVPTKLIDTFNLETASDDWLADFNSTGIADMAIGRLPGRTAAEVNLMVSKILSYEQERELNAPLRGAVMVADNGFESESSDTRALLPSGVAVQTINRAQVGNDDMMRGQIVDALNQGPMIVNYYGHGSVRVWTGAGVLDGDLAGSLTNVNRPSLFVLMTCLNGYASDAFIDSLSESALKAQNGGAVAVWASSGFTDPQPQFVMDSEFYRLLFGGQPLRLGEATRNAKAAVTDLDVRRTWMLFGDPAMRLR